MTTGDPAQPFAERLCQRIQALGSRLVVGIDPVLARFPAVLEGFPVEERLTRFSDGVLSAVRDQVAAVKVQVAFFERFGWRGWRAFQAVVESAARLGVPVIADAKRGDIGSTAAAYADAFLGVDPGTPGPFVDALTVNPYLGRDSLEPFVKRAREGNRGLFVLARTSNPGGVELQEHGTDGEPLYRVVARIADSLAAPGESGYGPVGLVAGATYPEHLADIRAAAPHAILLLPGIGTQGGKLSALGAAFDDRGLGGLASASRSIIYAEPAPGEAWDEAVARAAREHRQALEGALSLT